MIDLAVILIKVVVVFFGLLLLAAYMTWMERRVFGLLQVRYGPNRVGPAGLLQPIADGIKLMFKESLIPAQADKAIYLLAPIVTLIPAMSAMAVVPFGDSITVLGRKVDLVIADVNVGILYIFALAGIGIYGIVLAGWASNSKYPLLGGLRSSAQMISYELSMGLSLLGVIMISGTLSLKGIVAAQADLPFIVLQPVGFLIFLICMVAETNRAPFDLPEAESELTAGFHTEYSSMGFAMFFLAEYCNMITLSAVGATFFLGGWRGPFFPSVVWFLLKVLLFMFFFMWLRATTPRLRYDQLMGFGWKVLLPLSILNVIATAGVIAFLGL
ncbi:MAG: NADH-quinone oxidoreductase subunit NuoH [bacterium]|nr:NADH-quinone oxidoreductase subunit NuoH [bacterium]